MPYCQQIGWEDVPHLTPAQRADLMSKIPPHQRDARTKGIPILGSGAIYPVPWDDVKVKPFAIPAFWPKAYALDVGWRRTAALWGAKDPSDGVLYCYAEHYRGQAEPVVHAEAIKVRGVWIRGAIDPASRGRSQVDGTRLIESYRGLGLNLTDAKNEVEAGIYDVWSGLSLGRIRMFSTLQNTESEYRIYRRDEQGRIVKEHDHLMDCLRYLVMTWPKIASVQAPERSSSMSSTISDTQAGY